MVMGKLNRQPTPTGHLQLDQIVSILFPTQPPLTWQATGEGDTVLTSEAEVLAALRKTKFEKAPGPDGIPNAAPTSKKNSTNLERYRTTSTIDAIQAVTQLAANAIE